MVKKTGKEKAKDYYNQEAEGYIRQYQKDYAQYPANLIRINCVVERLKKNNIRFVLDAGCGTCGPMIRLIKEGFGVKGFDFSRKMIKKGKAELKKAGYDEDLIYCADLEDKSSLSAEKFDAAIALGVFPHIQDETKALSNIREALKPGGLVFIEFRNDLFAAYTMNRYSLDFFLNRVIDLKSLPRDIRDEVIGFYSERLKLGRLVKKEKKKIAYTDILAKFRNPLTIDSELFKPRGFSIADIHFYHYHALPPVFAERYPELFRRLSLKMERPNDWKGYLMASAYVVEAKRTD